MSLTDQLTETRNASATNLPADIHATMLSATQHLKESGIENAAPKVGEKIALFDLPNHQGEQRKLSELLDSGPVVLTFYRGGWCPYCNLELRAYQAHLDSIKAAGATLVAVSPELPDVSLSTSEKNELSYEVLSDVDSTYAKELGLVFSLAEELRPIYLGFGIEVEKHNGSGQFDLPLAATFVIKQDGTIAHAFVTADYTLRQDPVDVVKALNAL